MGFEACHPAVNLLYFAAVITGMIAFRHPVFLGISFLCAFAYSLRRNRWKALVFNLILIPLTVLFAFYYSSYHHFGMTELRLNFVGNRMTLESLVYGLVLGFVIAGTMIWMSCVYSVFTTDKVVYLFGKVSPRLSLFLAILLRMVPRIKQEGRRINTARRGVGKGTDQGNLLQRTVNSIRIFSMLISWTIGALATASDSMRSRGSILRGRTAFSIYRFDNRDRAYVIGLFACLTITAMGYLLRQTRMVYDPRLQWTPLTVMSYAFYLGYAVFCLMPLGLELYTEWRFRRARERSVGA
jgi:energy-coupling factor transport system permease protein